MIATTQSIVDALLPYIVGLVVATQGWIVKQIIDLGRWKAMADERCKQHQIRDQNLEKQVPIALSVLGDHGAEMDTIRTSISRLDQRLIDGFERMDERLATMETNYTATIQALLKSNTIPNKGD